MFRKITAVSEKVGQKIDPGRALADPGKAPVDPGKSPAD